MKTHFLSQGLVNEVMAMQDNVEDYSSNQNRAIVERFLFVC